MRDPSSRSAAVSLVTGTVLALAWPQAADALPDIVPEVYDVQVRVGDVLQADVDEGCAGGRFNRRLVKFSLQTNNIGADDLILGNPGCPNCSLNPGAICANPLFECGTAHGHAHFEGFAHNQILDGGGAVVAEGQKYGFCLLDVDCPTPHYSCSSQGITAGCHDVYSAGLPCQYIDITDAGLPDGVYTLRVSIDPENLLAESDDANNTIDYPFTIGQTDQVCPLYTSTDIPKAIPDPGTATSAVSVPDLGPVTSMRIRMAGTHPYFGDLDASLTNPVATTRTLFSDMCGAANDFDVYLGDDAADPFVCPATDSQVLRTPAESFDAFHGQPSGGTWTLTISDTEATDTGTLDSWSLEICSTCGNGEIDPGESCDDGNVDDGDCCSSDCQAQAGNGASCEDGKVCTTGGTCQSGHCVPGGDVSCDPCLVCDPDQGCVVPDLVYPCQAPPARGAVLKIIRDPFDPEEDSLFWRWRSQTPVELDELGAPDVVTDVSVCIYEGGNLFLSATIPAARTCDRGEPCWERLSHRATFSDRLAQFGGLTTIKMKEGNKGKIFVKGIGAGLGIADLGLQLPATVRMRRSDGTPCWEATYDAASVASPTTFKARSR